MALIQANFISTALMRTVTINVILPADKPSFPGLPPREDKPYKTLYLLHGILGNYTDWISGTNIQRWAEEKNLAVVMPSGDNMFYLDHNATNNLYGEYVGNDLVETTRKLFPLSRRREDTFIAGLSMGGYGAIRNGLKYHDTFSHIAGLSSAVLTDDYDTKTDDGVFFFESRAYAEAVFGDLKSVKESDKNPAWLAAQLHKQGVSLPKMYLACGTEDSLLWASQKLHHQMLAVGADITYEEGPGGHDWTFWNEYIRKVIDWLPLEEQAQSGISSGNIGL